MQIRTPVTEITVAAPRERILLALLLLREGQLVPVQHVITALWDTSPPPTARAQVHSCVSRLRRLLRRAGLPEDLVVTEPAGYRIKVGPEDLDAALFATRVERGRAAATDGDLAGGRDELRAALSLWRDRPLTDVDSDLVRAAAAHLDEQWTAAMALCLDLELQLDLAEEILVEVTDLVERYPHHEQFRGHLMTALVRTGRRADALAVFRRGRALLAEELGIEPGAELVELHRRILNGDAALLLPQVPRSLGRRAARCLPRDVADFAGRAELVQRLVGVLRDERPEVVAIDGMPGTGKTTLAVRVAHTAAERYPDGQLYLDLRGHSDRAPLDPGEAIGALLRQLGVPAERVPPCLDDRAVLWRTELADRQVLVLLDNALDTAQVLPMLPGTGHTGVVITSRRRLGGLDGAQTVSLDVLPLDDAVELLRRTVGERAYTDPAHTIEVAELCGRLPLAVRLAGARLQHRPGWSVSDLAIRLRTADRRLPELAVDGRTVAAAFTLSYQQLAVPLRRLFAVLGLHPSGDFEPAAAAALAGLPVHEAEALLEDLVDVHLVEAPEAGRYRLHDLLRDYAAQLAQDDTAALLRLLDHYLYSAVGATRFMELSDARSLLRLDAPPPTALELATPPEARRWLERELPNVLGAARLAAEAGQHRHTCMLTRAVSPLLFGFGFGETQLDDLYERAIEAAVALPDAELEGESRNYLAAVYFRTGRLTDALTTLQTVVRIGERENLPRLIGTALTNLAMLHSRLGQYPEAIASAEAAADIAIDEVPPSLEFKRNSTIGLVHTQAGNYAQALAANRRGLAVARRIGGIRPVAIMIGELGLVHLHLGHLTVATALLQRALVLKRDSVNQYGAAETLSKLGTAYRLQGRIADAVTCQRVARDQMERVADVSGQCLAANDLALTLRAAGRGDEADWLNKEAYAKASRIGDRYEQARALAGLNRMDEAVALFTSLGARDLTALTR
ncbi:BTAD domain-containing putative transcriptional regulator [Dactylosporangium sp. NPDC051484]|uniref:AfsR/SARP family transcriptional regulator n=1 Tax=Dactylosporangium sp. NPDC051484 TaxID=3154942 RepID=UPI003450F504